MALLLQLSPSSPETGAAPEPTAAAEIVFQPPEYYGEPNENGSRFYEEAGKTVANLRILEQEYPASGEDDSWKQAEIQRWMTLYQEDQRCVLIDGPNNIRDVEIAGAPGCAFDLQYRSADNPAVYSARFVLCRDAGNERLIHVVLYVFGESERDLYGDFDAMIAGAEREVPAQ